MSQVQNDRRPNWSAYEGHCSVKVLTNLWVAGYSWHKKFGQTHYALFYEMYHTPPNTMIPSKVIVKVVPFDTINNLNIRAVVRHAMRTEVGVLNGHNHDNVMGAYAYGDCTRVFPLLGCAVMVMAKATCDMSKYIRLAKPRYWSMYSQLAKGLEHMHNTINTAHLDLKPENIFMFQHAATKRWTVKLGDFGCARPANVMCNKFMGTVGYQAPEVRIEKLPAEQRNDPPPFDPRKADIWALGVVFFEMLTGANSYAGLNDLRVLKPKWQVLLSSMLADAPKERITIEDVVLELMKMEERVV